MLETAFGGFAALVIIVVAVGIMLKPTFEAGKKAKERGE
jgi:hypothetical protein